MSTIKEQYEAYKQGALNAGTAAMDYTLWLEHCLVSFQSEIDRLRQRPGVWDALTTEQRVFLQAASSTYGMSLLTYEEDKMRQARELVKRGWITEEFNQRHGRSYTYYLTIAGRELLQTSTKEGSAGNGSAV